MWLSEHVLCQVVTRSRKEEENKGPFKSARWKRWGFELKDSSSADEGMTGERQANRNRAPADRGTQESLKGRLLLFEGSAPLLLLLSLLLLQLLLLTDLLLKAVGRVYGVDLSKETLVNKSSSDF